VRKEAISFTKPIKHCVNLCSKPESQVCVEGFPIILEHSSHQHIITEIEGGIISQLRALKRHTLIYSKGRLIAFHNFLSSVSFFGLLSKSFSQLFTNSGQEAIRHKFSLNLQSLLGFSTVTNFDSKMPGSDQTQGSELDRDIHLECH
jgi:hypothetical protein